MSMGIGCFSGSLMAANTSLFFKLQWVSEESHESIVEGAQGIQILVLFVLFVREKSKKVRVGRVSERIAYVWFLDDALDLLGLFEVLLVGDLGGRYKTDDRLHVHRRHLHWAIEELIVLR